MKTIKNIIYISALTVFFSLSLLSCKEDSLLFPIEIEDDGDAVSSERGPVKQNNFSVIIENDELIKFDVSSVDRERVASLIFSHDRDGESIETEVTDFTEYYVVANLSLDQVSNIEIWAIGYDGLVSKKSIYKVQPKPFPAKNIVKTVSVRGQNFSGILNISNSSALNARLYYKIDDASNFSFFEVPVSTIGRDYVIPTKLTVGSHTVQYYVEDQNGNSSNIFQSTLIIIEPTIKLFSTAADKASWTPWSPNGYPGYTAQRAIDGKIEATYEFITEARDLPNQFKISFTKDRVISDPNYKTSVVQNPSGNHDLLVVKSATLYSGGVDWDPNPSIARVWGYLENGTAVDLGLFSNPTPVTFVNPFVIDLSSNVLPLKAIRFEIISSLTEPYSIGFNLNEINLTGYYY